MILTQNHRMEQIRSQHYNLLRFLWNLALNKSNMLIMNIILVSV